MENDPYILKGDSKRQAINPLMGFSYQIWQSLYRWITLQEDQALILEGAEDIDLLGPGYAEPIQVKKTEGSGSLTLRSKDILDAITHFWQHQQNHPQLVITFRFLTTTERGHEQSKPFGEIRGLDYWDSCKFPGTNLSPLRSFLSGVDVLPKELRAFIIGSTDEELRQRLIKRIEWDTGNKPQTYIVELVNNKVVAYGYRVDYLSPSESEKVVPHLLKHVWDVVLRRENRRLIFQDFMRLFEEVTSERESKSKLRYYRHLAFLSSQRAGGSALGGGGQSFTLLPESIFETISPPLNDRLVLRKELVTKLSTQLNSVRIMALTGSTGMGKSTLANAIATADGELWRRFSMRGLEPEEIRERLLYATRAVEEQSDEFNFIIDDLNFDKKPSVYEEALAKFIYTIILRAGRIIITTQGTLPVRIISMHDLRAECVADVPALSEAEVQELAANHGCPQGHMLKAWSRIIAIYTSRHPLLVHARVKSLETKGWPAPTEDDLGLAQDLEDVRRQIRQRLRELLPSEEARTLAYRLSIIGGRFQRTNALYLGQYPPCLKMPGEAFDTLIGPWVERAGDKYFRLSPLLDHAAEENFSKEEVTKLHEAAASAFISQGLIGPIELDAILFHGLIGEARDPLAAAAMATFRAEDEHWPDVSRMIEWFGRCRLQHGEKLFAKDPLVSLILRRLQFKVVAEIDGTRALRVAEAWEREVEEWDGSGLYPGVRSAMQLTFLNDLLFSLQTPTPIKTIVSYISKVIPLAKGAGNFFPDHVQHNEPFKTHAKKIFNAHTYVRVAVAHCKDASAVVEFLTLLDNHETTEADPIWKIFGHDDYLSMMLIDQIWIDETKTPSPDWDRCLERLQYVIELGMKREATPIIVAAYRAKATVQEEYLKDAANAINTITEGESKIGYPHPLLEDYRAKILVLEKQYAEALSVWEKTLPQLKQYQNPTRTFSYRDAEICAARLHDWKKAGEFALEGVAAAHQMLAGAVPDGFKAPETELVATGFKADYAFAQWKFGDRSKATHLFAEVLDAFDQLPDPNNDIKANMLYKRVGHAVAWLNHDVQGRTDFLEPPPGCFSNQEVFEGVNDLPMQPRLLLWFLLAKVEYRLDIGDAIFHRFEQEHKLSNSPDSRAGYANLLLGHTLKSLTLEPLVSIFMKSLADLRTYAAEEKIEKDQLSDTLVLISFLFAALIKLVGRDQYQSIPLNDWRKDAAEWGVLTDSLSVWLDFVERSLSADHFDLVTTLMNESAPSEIRLVAAILLSASDTPNPEERFYANVLLVTTNFYESWREETEDIIDWMISSKWLVVAERDKFSLLFPKLNAEIIASACRDESCRGLRKAAGVLLAVKSAVRTSVAEDLLDTLRERARQPTLPENIALEE